MTNESVEGGESYFFRSGFTDFGEERWGGIRLWEEGAEVVHCSRWRCDAVGGEGVEIGRSGGEQGGKDELFIYFPDFAFANLWDSIEGVLRHGSDALLDSPRRRSDAQRPRRSDYRPSPLNREYGPFPLYARKRIREQTPRGSRQGEGGSFEGYG